MNTAYQYVPQQMYRHDDSRFWGFGFRPWGFRPWGFGFGYPFGFGLGFGAPFFPFFPFFI
ncbi:hypothetical protein SM124_01865 [Bacillus sp. 31A1R]|uniref:Spore coat protein n=1 Tax=Robertmurraya mangrovi TaxID=3098077 RepID=A0ABU5ITK0_9BACI|nr:hypothetical protein [Bacillus sp. 31A1R]MDZ5470485.1 hypothetical protein [Bacillus sp. 31A1R]